MTATAVNLNEYGQTKYERIKYILACALGTKKSNVTIDSAKQFENGDIEYRVKRKGAFNYYLVLLHGNYWVHTRVEI